MPDSVSNDHNDLLPFLKLSISPEGEDSDAENHGRNSACCGRIVFGGVFDSGYTRVVARPPAEVAAAIEDLDITSAPGEPGSDPAMAGGVRPVVGVERLPDRVVWTVRSGDKIATRMTALLEPIEGGKETRVRATVERGDAPDDKVSPAFRSERRTLALFSIVLEAELNHLTSERGWDDHCEAIIERFQNAAIDELEQGRGPSAAHATGLAGGYERAAKANIRINAIDTELRNAGCDPDANQGPFRPVETHMAPADPATAAEAAHPGVSFRPGKPMVDVSRR